MNGATQVFIEPDEHYGMNPEKIEQAITDKTKAVLVTHLYGMASRMDEISVICKKYNLKLVEDCAQSHGACFDGKMTGSFGDIGCFLFYPSKNLGALVMRELLQQMIQLSIEHVGHLEIMDRRNVIIMRL